MLANAAPAEDVLRLEVEVHDALVVHVPDGRTDLEKKIQLVNMSGEFMGRLLTCRINSMQSLSVSAKSSATTFSKSSPPPMYSITCKKGVLKIRTIFLFLS